MAGPWNMSRRAELKLGPRLKVHAVIDPDAERAKRALAEKSSTFASGSYESTVVLPSLAAYADKVRAGTAPSPK
jgi:predicted dehydrogenase